MKPFPPQLRCEYFHSASRRPRCTCTPAPSRLPLVAGKKRRLAAQSRAAQRTERFLVGRSESARERLKRALCEFSLALISIPFIRLAASSFRKFFFPLPRSRRASLLRQCFSDANAVSHRWMSAHVHVDCARVGPVWRHRVSLQKTLTVMHGSSSSPGPCERTERRDSGRGERKSIVALPSTASGAARAAVAHRF